MSDSDFISINKKVKSFSSSPKFAPYDMVILDISDDLYVSSPYATLDETKWQTRSNGEHKFVYDATNSVWIYNGSTNVSTAVLLSTYGIQVVYYSDNSFTDAAKDGDTVSVRKFTKDDTSEGGEREISVTYELTRSGSVLETDCPLCYPSQRQTVANNVLKEMYGYEYQPYKADGAVVSPLAELGDGVKAFGRYGGLYQQTTNFTSLMTSDISAPGQEESESEFPYESEQDRSYKRQLANVSATLTIQADRIAAEVSQRIYEDQELSGLIETTATAINLSVTAVSDNLDQEIQDRQDGDDELYTGILDPNNPNSLKVTTEAAINLHSDQIAARVTKTGGTQNHSFGWDLTDSSWTLSNATTDIFVADSTGIYVVGNGEFTGTITANDGQIANFVIDQNAIYHTVNSFGDSEHSRGVYVGTDGIQLGQRFSVDDYGNVTANNLELYGGELNMGSDGSGGYNFTVDRYGNVEIKRGSIQIGSDGNGNSIFEVDNYGQVTARNLELYGGNLNLGSNGNGGYAFSVDNFGNVDISRGSIQIGQDQSGNVIFEVDNYGSVTARDLSLYGGSLNLGSDGNGGYVFSVDNYGNVDISSGSIRLGKIGNTNNYHFEVDSYGNVRITQGEIAIGSDSHGGYNFYVDSSGNLTANNGTFSGTVYAGNIQQRNANDTMSGSLLTPATLNGDSLLEPSSITGNGGILSAGTFDGDSLLSSGSIAGAGGGALDADAIGGIGEGLKVANVESQADTLEWVCCNHFVCYSGGHINGSHYGLWYDDIEEHGVSWQTANIMSGASATATASSYIWVRNPEDTDRIQVPGGFNISVTATGTSQIKYLGC